MARVDLYSLAESPLFKGLKEPELIYLADFFQSREIESGKTVFVENMPGEALYLIRSGKVQVSMMQHEADEQNLVSLNPGDVFGELAVIDGNLRVTSARVAERAQLYSLSRKDFLKLAAEKPRLGIQLTLNIAKVLSVRLRQAKKDYRAMLALLANKD
jgi:CRP-like cAMP-binding protein